MKKADREFFQKLLDEMREEVSADLKQLNEKVERIQRDMPEDFEERASFIEQRDVLYIQWDQKQEELRKIDEALTALQTGSYGRCAQCGREIDIERLKFLPLAVYCAECQAALEG